MVDAQAQLARWVTEMKAGADSVALRVQRTLEGDKGASAPTLRVATLARTAHALSH